MGDVEGASRRADTAHLAYFRALPDVQLQCFPQTGRKGPPGDQSNQQLYWGVGPPAAGDRGGDGGEFAGDAAQAQGDVAGVVWVERG